MKTKMPNYYKELEKVLKLIQKIIKTEIKIRELKIEELKREIE